MDRRDITLVTVPTESILIGQAVANGLADSTELHRIKCDETYSQRPAAQGAGRMHFRMVRKSQGDANG